MNKKSCWIITIFVLSAVLPGTIVGDSLSVDYYSAGNIYRFAEYLYKEGDYLRAAGEFQRYLFVVDTQSVAVDSALFYIGKCYLKARKYERAMDYFKKVAGSGKTGIKDHAHYNIALCYFLADSSQTSIDYLTAHLNAGGIPELESSVKNLNAAGYLEQGKWGKAEEILGPDSLNDRVSNRLLSWVRIGKSLPRKSKTLAGLYSGIIPGLGKVYCKRSVDGIQSFLTVGLLGWQAYTGFHKDGKSSVKGWIFGSIGALFYLGNIYGSIVAADIHNQEQEERLKTEIRVFFYAHLD